jgi:hypothetical protein
MSETPPMPAHEPMQCAEVRPYLSAFVDNELAEPLRTRVARHVAGCDDCAARAEQYRAIDVLLARAPQTAPSAEVFHAVMAAARERSAEPVEREPLAPFSRLSMRRLRVVRPAPRHAEVRAAPARKAGWAATAIPTIAALLLVTLAALAFRGLIMLPRENAHPTATATPVGSILEQTQQKIDAIALTTPLPFTPVLPTFVPNGVSSVDASLGYASDNTTVIYLEIAWNVTSSAYLRAIHIRESKGGYQYFGYTPDYEKSGWQLVDKRPWQPLKNAGIGQITLGSVDASVAAGEDRGALSLAVEAIGTSPRSDMLKLTTVTRQVALSMDGENKQIPIAAIQPNGLTLHYQAQAGLARGETPAWSVNAYIDPATDAQRVEVSADGSRRYVDVSQGAQAIRWDATAHAYATGTRSQFSGDMNPNTNGNFNVMHTFYAPGELLQNGLLWYSGRNTTVYDYILVSAPNRTHVYVDQKTKQVVQVKVDADVPWNAPPSPTVVQLFGDDGCSYFTLIEYIPPESVPAGTFSLTPPGGASRGVAPPTVKCK